MAATDLEAHLRSRRDAGRKLLVPYVTGGLGPHWCDVVRACADAGADAIEIGLPFSDPVMDGPTIQEASMRALQLGATPPAVIAAAADLDVDCGLVCMTSYNLVFRAGHERFAASLAAAGIGGAIVPDLPLEELGPWESAAEAAGVAPVLLAFPVTPDDRLHELCRRARGFVYGVNLMGVTGERTGLADTATVLAKRLKAVTDKPVLMGFGVSNAETAVAAASESDGVIVGAAVMRRMLEGESPEQVGAFVAELRAALDAG